MNLFDYDGLGEAEERIHSRLVSEYSWDNDATTPYERERAIKDRIEAIVADELPMLSFQARENLIQRVYDRVAGLGPIEQYMRNPAISEIMVNGPQSVWVQYRGNASPTEVPAQFTDEDAVRRLIDQIVAPTGRRIDQAQPVVDTRLPDGSRVHAALRPISLNGPVLTIRKFPEKVWTLPLLVEEGTIPNTIGDFLDRCVRGQVNMLVSGGTNAGKTTTLNALSSHIPDGDRIVTIEDTAELQLNHHNLVRLEARPANIEGKGEITIRELVRNALRMRPNRIIVGECRGPEALDMLQAMNTGHDGSLTTLHANSAEDAMTRLETMTLMATSVNLPLSAVREQIRSSLRIVMQQRLYPDGKRRIETVGEVVRQAPTGGDTGIEVRKLYAFHRMPTQDASVVEGYWECLDRPTDNLLRFMSERSVMLTPDLFRPGRLD